MILSCLANYANSAVSIAVSKKKSSAPKVNLSERNCFTVNRDKMSCHWIDPCRFLQKIHLPSLNVCTSKNFYAEIVFRTSCF